MLHSNRIVLLVLMANGSARFAIEPSIVAVIGHRRYVLVVQAENSSARFGECFLSNQSNPYPNTEPTTLLTLPHLSPPPPGRAIIPHVCALFPKGRMEQEYSSPFDYFLSQQPQMHTIARGCHSAKGPSMAIPQHTPNNEEGPDARGAVAPCTQQGIPKYFREWTKFRDEDDEDVNKSNNGEGAEQPEHDPPSEPRLSVPATHCEPTTHIATSATARQVPLPVAEHNSGSIPPLTREPTCSPLLLQTPIGPVCALENTCEAQSPAANGLESNYYASTYAAHFSTRFKPNPFVQNARDQGSPPSGTDKNGSRVSSPQLDSRNPYSSIDASAFQKQTQATETQRARGTKKSENLYNSISQKGKTRERAEDFATVTDSTAAHQKEARGVNDIGREFIIEKKEVDHPSRPKEKRKEKRGLPPRPHSDANGRSFVRKLVQADGTSAKPLRVTIMAKIGLERNISRSERITCPLPGCDDVVIADDLFSHFGSHFKKLDLPEAGPHDCLLKCGNKPLGTLAALKKHLRQLEYRDEPESKQARKKMIQ
ncbi:uncharacterized protein FOMMEDRAFT_149690 [Fomitiporia mediterranea MF3/22]|uniref:uncharacterized protein n=1 Tax=Fomitiporia mediterranea (strain MF3/22) TaxID=694068 RepID=UPI0004408237|nr:uncharacterized protein FOMMEDRAFT_149690 [Fomitiporia mediterranea MF3/22]EJD07191.1 hypothetical protein FOMMEDRAFT_149690 [Fomitiporia mediterranea MF3/22]